MMVTSSQGEPLVAGLVEIHTTFDARDQAMACADRLVRARLAACVQVDGPITSTYSWQGAVEQAEEWRWTCKTTREAAGACAAAIVGGHSYAVPQVVIVPVEATEAYAAWVRSVVAAA